MFLKQDEARARILGGIYSKLCWEGLKLCTPVYFYYFVY